MTAVLSLLAAQGGYQPIISGVWFVVVIAAVVLVALAFFAFQRRRRRS